MGMVGAWSVTETASHESRYNPRNKVNFLPPKLRQNSPTAMYNLKKFPGRTPGPALQGREGEKKTERWGEGAIKSI